MEGSEPIRIGPTRCPFCGGEYGEHTPNCAYREPTPMDPPPQFVPMPVVQARSAAKAHLTVCEAIYHTVHDGTSPTGNPNNYSFPLTTDEQPFQRWQKVGTQWVPIETGWLEAGSMLVLRNEGKVNVHLGVAEPDSPTEHVLQFGTIRPGGSARFEPNQVGNLRLSTNDGECRCSVTLFPE